MIAGQFREYNWRDIERLIIRDSGIESDEAQRTMSEIWFESGFKPLDSQGQTCVLVKVYEKPFSKRTEEHYSP